MTDIREILNSIDAEDKRLFELHRTEMRRSYLTAHNSVLGVNAWDVADDCFLDYIDIKLALLFDKSGRMKYDTMAKTIVAIEDATKIEDRIQEERKKSALANPMVGSWKATLDGFGK